MARVNLSFTRKYTAALDSKMRAQLADFANMSACAGIRDNPDAAFKARVNHHGAMSTRVPARRFITAATMNLKDGNFASELRSTIKELVQQPTPRTLVPHEVRRAVTTRVGEKSITVIQDVRGNVFGRPAPGRQRGPVRVLKQIADKIAENQRQAIAGRVFEGGPTYGQDPQHNAPRVIKKKGKDSPLVDTGDMLAAIKGWVE